MKKAFNIILTILLLGFSFYYTNMVSNYLKNKDPIMIKIKSEEKKYYKEPINATIINNTIIPGVSGISINVDESYSNMKKVNNYAENLLVFKTEKPLVSLENNLDKLIIQGNSLNKNISILLKIDNLKLLKKVLEESDNSNLNFVFSTNFITENKAYLKTLDNNIITEVSDTENDLTDYCYTTNLNFSKLCSNTKTVFTNLITHDYYYNTYQILENGKILTYQILNDKSLNELNILLSGIKNLNYEIVSLDTLLTE